jgi:hypothetical protein
MLSWNIKRLIDFIQDPNSKFRYSLKWKWSFHCHLHINLFVNSQAFWTSSGILHIFLLSCNKLRYSCMFIPKMDGEYSILHIVAVMQSQNYIFQPQILKVLYAHCLRLSQLWKASMRIEVESDRKFNLKVFLCLLHEIFRLFISFALLKLETE